MQGDAAQPKPNNAAGVCVWEALLQPCWVGLHFTHPGGHPPPLPPHMHNTSLLTSQHNCNIYMSYVCTLLCYITQQEVLASEPVAPVTTKLECAKLADGAACLLLVPGEHPHASSSSSRGGAADAAQHCISSLRQSASVHILVIHRTTLLPYTH